jgi:hypothetical protein
MTKEIRCILCKKCQQEIEDMNIGASSTMDVQWYCYHEEEIMTETQPEIIKIIQEFDEHGDNLDFEGFRIFTTKQMIELKIENNPQCCERWGHICSEYCQSFYIGAELLEIVAVDEKCETTVVKLKKAGINCVADNEEFNAIFINIITNLGTLQFTLYNDHSGYYGHEVIVTSKQLTLEKVI